MADKNSWLLLGTIHYTTEPPPATLLPLLARQLRPGAEPIPRDEQEQGAHPGMEAGAPEQELIPPTGTASPGEPGTHRTAVQGTVASSKPSVSPSWDPSLGHGESSRGPACPLPGGVPGLTQPILTALPGSQHQVRHTRCQPRRC